MVIAAPPKLTAISAGSREAPAFPSTVISENPVTKPADEFDPQIFKTLSDFDRISLLRTPLEDLSGNALSRFGEFKVARIAMRVLGGVSQVDVVGWRGNDQQGKRDIRVDFEDETVSQIEIEVKYGIAHDGQHLQRYFMRSFRDYVPEAERYTREGREKAMWRQGIMLINGTKAEEEIAESMRSQLKKIKELAPVVLFEAEPKVDIGQLAFSGKAKPNDMTRWIKQNPQ